MPLSWLQLQTCQYSTCNPEGWSLLVRPGCSLLRSCKWWIMGWNWNVWIGLQSLSRGARVSPEDSDIPHWAHKGSRKGMELPAPGMGFIHLQAQGQRGQSKGDTAWDSPGVTFSAQGGQAVPTAASNLVLVGPEHSEARAALVTHITKIVFTAFIHLHLYSCEWQVFVPHMEGTLGEAVFRYLLTILWKDIKSVNFQIKFEHYNEK